jgi:hypothetical protein
VIDAVRALVPRIRAAADETEAGRRVPRAIVDGLIDAGVFRSACRGRSAASRRIRASWSTRRDDRRGRLVDGVVRHDRRQQRAS